MTSAGLDLALGSSALPQERMRATAQPYGVRRDVGVVEARAAAGSLNITTELGAGNVGRSSPLAIEIARAARLKGGDR